eukprot:scaffold5259_cov120-Cylindrotheca_fusiformis.AAC.2
MDDATKEERPNLCKLLEERLSEFGLDSETYGPYVVGSDAEELPDVMELLKASSENETNDDVWDTFTKDILNSLKLDEEFQKGKEEMKIQEAQKREQELAEKNKAAMENATVKKPAAETKSSQVDDATKKALMQRFGYEEPEEEEAPAVVTNKQVAASANLEKAQELRSKKTQTKKEEQQKTKEQKNMKTQLKEERRKKAQKGERKR